MKKNRYFQTMPNVSRKDIFWRIIVFSVLASMLVAGTASNVFVQNAYAANTLVINAVATDGRVLNMWTTISSGGSVVKSGLTPLNFIGTTGASYSVTVSDYASLFFNNWDNGSTARARTVTLNADTTITATYRTGSIHSLVVNSADMTSNSLTGFYTIIRAGATTVRTGFTSLPFAGNHGTSYSVTVSDYGSFVFDHWNDGSNTRTRTVTLNADTTITAHYRSNAPGYTLTVNSVGQTGNALPGFYTTVTAAGSSTVKTGFTPFSHVGNAGATYSVTVSDYGSFVFDHWNDGSNTRTRTVTLNANTAITAYLRDTSTAPPPSPNPDPSPIADLIPKTGVFVALYMYPGGGREVHWQTVYDTKIAHPSVPIVAVFNPSSGPGTRDDNVISGWVDKLKSAGVIMIGYTHSNYGGRSLDALKADADKYRDWYGADGLFIDEFDNDAGSEGQYRDLTAYAKSIGKMKMTMGNPGTDVPRSYIGTVDVINIAEGRGYMPISWLQYCIGCGPNASNGWHYLYDKRNFAYIRYEVPTLDTAFETESAKWVGLLYIHSGLNSQGRWFDVPSYFGTMVATLDVP